MSLAIFDLDNTLLGGDSDYLWGRFLIENGIVDAIAYEQANQRFYEDYQAGTLDIQAFLGFALKPLAENDPADLVAWRQRFMTEKIRPIMLSKAQTLLDKHRSQGNVLVIITATNRFVTEPIAEALRVSHLLATEPEWQEGRYTGRPIGIPCFQDGKVQRLEAWLKDTGHTLAGSWFYSDSHNDLPLLGRVDNPVAVDPDLILERHARQRGWPVIT
ncbi:MAG: HAD family hydrolase, partial [Candidatus Competibacteraceae bacterium]|nr:HAD family hydrolase [Candidatus Competibacteraceae bacterium]